MTASFLHTPKAEVTETMTASFLHTCANCAALLLLSCGIAQTAGLTPVPFTQVAIDDHFWSPKMDTCRNATLPHSLDMLESRGSIEAFDKAAGVDVSGEVNPRDQDLYKVLEGAAYVLAEHRDEALEKRVDGIIAGIERAQMPDGYINTRVQIDKPDKRWTSLGADHELYCAGHLIEAGIAYYQATGKRSLLDVALKFADLISSRYGDGPGQLMGYPGHPEAELALVRLWRATGEQRYLDTARFFILNRGSHYFAREENYPDEEYNHVYRVDDIPMLQRRTIDGHAVRAVYLMCGATDVALATGDERFPEMLDAVWRDTVNKKMFITGGVGSVSGSEAFGAPYELPTYDAYQETCGTVAMAMWAQRMCLLHGDASYADHMERALYNSVLSGASQDGRSFFYRNPLASKGNKHRAKWHNTACCPSNLSRLLPSIGGYAYSTSEDALYVNLYMQGSVKARVGENDVALDVRTDYPWDGRVEMSVHPASPAAFELRLRVPGWCTGAELSVNGKAIDAPHMERGYAVLSREWRDGDSVTLDIPLEVRRVEAHPEVESCVGGSAFMRGPIVYCFEGCDQEAPLDVIGIPAGARFAPEKRDILGGVVALAGEGQVLESDWPSSELYAEPSKRRTVPLVAVPYFAWDNREPGPMKVWMPYQPPVKVE